MSRIFTPIAALFAVSLFLSCACAQAKTPSAGSDQSQIDGICKIVTGELWNRTDYYFDAGDYPRSIALDRVITAADPQFMEAYVTGAWLMDSLGDKKDAEAFYTQCVTNNPKHSYGYYNLGWFYYNSLKNYPKALTIFQADVKTPDADVNDWKMLAHSYEKLGQYDRALAVWKQTKKLYPNGPAVDFNLAQAEQRAQQHPVNLPAKTTP